MTFLPQSDDSSRTASPCSDVDGGGGARRVGSGTGRREKKGPMMSEDSEGSSLDSSDNEFEEQIRKMKVSSDCGFCI